MAASLAPVRDYSLVGPEAARAEALGFGNAVWYSPALPRKRLKALMKRSDGPAARDTALWIGLLMVSGAGGIALWGSWACVPFFAVYGVLYGSASDSRWHESGHGTAFRTPWMNVVLHHVASFMILREPTVWRWSHTRHHTDTTIVGRDPEIAVPRPPSLWNLIANVFALRSGAGAIRKMLLHAAGRMDAQEIAYVPEHEWRGIFRTARVWLGIYGSVGLLCIASGSVLPAMLVGFPSFYGGGMTIFFGLTQHAGLAEDVTDHRLNTRTVYMNPVFRFLYWNMNYHLEHHLYPTVPYHALPELHEAIKDECPAPYPSTVAAYREILPAVQRQRRDPSYHVVRELPASATAAAAGGTTSSGDLPDRGIEPGADASRAAA